jgi:hypothetical protein
MNPRIAAMVEALSGKKKKPESESMPESMPESKPVESLPEKPRKSIEQQLLEKEHIDMDYPTYDVEDGESFKTRGGDTSLRDEEEHPKRRGLFGDGGKGLSIIIAMGKGAKR